MARVATPTCDSTERHPLAESDLPAGRRTGDRIHPVVCSDGSPATCIDCLDPPAHAYFPAEEWDGPTCNGRIFVGCGDGYVHCPSDPPPFQCVNGENLTQPTSHICDTTAPLGILNGQTVYTVRCPSGEIPECLPPNLSGGCAHLPELCEPACESGAACIDGECRCLVQHSDDGILAESHWYASYGCPSDQRCECRSSVWNDGWCFDTECRDRYPEHYWWNAAISCGDWGEWNCGDVLIDALETPTVSIRSDDGFEMQMPLEFNLLGTGWVASNYYGFLSSPPRLEVVIHEGPDATVWATCEGQAELERRQWNLALSCELGARRVSVTLERAFGP